MPRGGLEDVRWALVTYEMPEACKSILSRFNNALRRYGVPVRPRVFLVPRPSVASVNEALTRRLRRRLPLVDVFVLYFHSESDAEQLACVCAEREMASLLASFSGKARDAKKRGEWVEDRVGRRVLDTLEGARNVLTFCEDPSEGAEAAYEELASTWERYYAEVHGGVLAGMREPVQPKSYRVRAGKWFADRRSQNLKGLEQRG